MSLESIAKSIGYRTKRIITTPGGFYKYFKNQRLTDIQKWFAAQLLEFKPTTASKNAGGIVLVEMVRDHEFCVRLAAASKVIAEKNNLGIGIYDAAWVKRIGRADRFQKSYELFFEPFHEKLYKVFGKQVVFRGTDGYKDQKLIKSKLEEIKAGLTKPEDIIALEIDDILIGDLVYDTYLRFFHQPTVSSIDSDLINVLEVTLNMFYNFKELLNKKTVKFFVASYTTYIDHGIPTRMCLNQGIPVYTIASLTFVAQQVSKAFPYHVNNHSIFSSERRIDQQKLDKARKIFTSRFSGKIDPALNYMNRTAFLNEPIDKAVKDLFERRKRNLVIYAHDFFDSPHVYRKLMFPDLYLFLKKSLEGLISLNDTTVFIKPHPNGSPDHKKIIKKIVDDLSADHFYILSDSVSNLNIVELAPDLVCTARGTVGIEMAYLGIPTVALFDNPYVNFDFVHTCKTLPEYFSILKGERAVHINFDKTNIYSFYYQAYLEKIEYDPNEFVSFLHQFKGDTFTDNYILFLKESNFFDSTKEFIQMHKTVISDIDKNKAVEANKRMQSFEGHLN